MHVITFFFSSQAKITFTDFFYWSVSTGNPVFSGKFIKRCVRHSESFNTAV